MPSAGYETVIPAIKWLQTYAINHTVTWIDSRIRIFFTKLDETGEHLIIDK
jgi:hypothetical protein